MAHLSTLDWISIAAGVVVIAWATRHWPRHAHGGEVPVAPRVSVLDHGPVALTEARAVLHCPRDPAHPAWIDDVHMIQTSRCPTCVAKRRAATDHLVDQARAAATRSRA